MEKLTFKDIKYILDELHDRRSSQFMWDCFLNSHEAPEQLSNDSIFKKRINPDFKAMAERLGNFSCIYKDENERSGYGEIPVKYIYYFSDHDVYMEVTGFWASYNGEVFDSCREVKPVTKTITIYE